MGNLKLRFRFFEPEVDTNLPLTDGTVKIEGFDLECVSGEADAWDQGFGALMGLMVAGAPYTCIPAFPNRKFRLSYIQVNSTAGIASAKDLEGKRVGIPQWNNTAGVWARGALQNYYHVDLSRIDWLAGKTEGAGLPPGRGGNLLPMRWRRGGDTGLRERASRPKQTIGRQSRATELFFRRRRDPGTPFNLLEKAYETPFPDRPPRAWQQFFNWQSRSLLSIFHDISALRVSAGPSADADLWRVRLRELVDEVFFVGIQDRFEQYVALLARRYGWQVFVPHSKPNPLPRASAEVSAEMRETILAYNWLDAELYELCQQAQERRELESPTPARQETGRRAS